jgi:SAM-dependent methyltransferase
VYFYEEMIRKVLRGEENSTILVVCGTGDDAQVLRALGYANVTVTNLDSRRADGIAPYAWEMQDAEALSYPDASFDWVIEASGLHHCASPHKALIEMYRVCRKGLLAMEARDSLVMKVAIALGLVPQFEQIGVATCGYETGGIRDTPTPNYILRWTEKDVHKVLESAYPAHLHEVRFYYGLRVPNYRLVMFSPFKRAAASGLSGMLTLFNFAFPKQGNRFAWAALKTGKLKPWMEPDGVHLRRDFDMGMDPAKYRGYSE